MVALSNKFYQSEIFPQLVSKSIFILCLLFHMCYSITTEEYYAKLARETPFCVDETVQDVKTFRPIFDYFKENPRMVIQVATTPEIPDNEEVDYIMTNAHGLIPQHKPPYEHRYKHLTVTFNRMNPLPVPSDYPLFNFRQWFHIHLKSSIALKALYIQSLSAPLGVPFGEFRNDFNCFDCKTGGKHYNITESDVDIVPCRFRAFHSYRHGNVVIIGGKSTVKEFYDAHVHFNWLEGACQQHPLQQFLFVAVRDFKPLPQSIDVFYSQVINNTEQDSIDGTAYPYYIDFQDKMACHGAPLHTGRHWTADMLKNFDPLKARPYKKRHSRLIYNKDYDDCVKNNGVGGDGINQCRPGPFRCIKSDGSPATDRDFNSTVKKRIAFYSSNDSEVCRSCFDKDIVNRSVPRNGKEILDEDLSLDNDGVLGDEFNPNEMEEEQSLIEEEFWLNANETNLMIKEMHGTLMIFAFVTGPLIANYLSRFYKETGNTEQGLQCANVGCWLWGHIGLSYTSLAAMWAGMGVVMFYDGTCNELGVGDKFACSESYHQLLGIISVLLFHINHLNGWCRPLSTSYRNIYIFWHVLFGYGSQAVAVAAFFVVHDAVLLEVSLAVASSFAAAAVFYILSTVVQMRIDKTLQLEVKRQWFPVPEAIGVSVDYSCLGSLRSLLLVFFILTQICLFVWVIVAQQHD